MADTSQNEKHHLSDLIEENLKLKSRIEDVETKLHDHVDDIADLEDAGKLVNSSFDLERILVNLMEISLKMTLADVGCIMLMEDKELRTKITWGLDGNVLDRVVVKASRRPVHCEAMENKKLLYYANLQEHPDIGIDEMDVMIESIICIPLLSKEKTIGVIAIINSMLEEELDAFATRMINAVAGFAAVAIVNALLHEADLQKQKYEQELQLGRDTQLCLLPQEPPKIDGYEIGAHYAATKDVGGDYYDLIDKGDELHVIIADVSNKGIPAALVMTATRAILRGTIDTLSAPKDILHQANSRIYGDINQGTDMFVTMFYGAIDINKRVLTYANAGHCYPLIFRKGLEDPIRLKEGGVFLGILEDVDYEQGEFPLQEGDLIFLYTDGVIEAVNRSLELFGEDRVCTFIKAFLHLSCQELVGNLYAELLTYSDYIPQADDIAMVAIKIHRTDSV